jgi:hypothetical protein
MRVATQLAIALSPNALCMKLSAQQTAVIISLTEQTARDPAAEFFARVKSGTPVKVIGSAYRCKHKTLDRRKTTNRTSSHHI